MAGGTRRKEKGVLFDDVGRRVMLKVLRWWWVEANLVAVVRWDEGYKQKES